MAGQVSSSAPVEDFQVATGDLLTRRSCSYQVQSFLGEGSFGKVAKCITMDSNQTVAMKIIKNHRDVMRQAKQEVSILNKLRALDPDTCNFVRWNGCFIDRGYMCLEFEILDISLQDFMRQRHFQPLPLKELRPILQQLATALKHLKTIGIIHTDLKPENIMMVDHRRQPHRVKVIDFGCAFDVSEARLGSCIQPRWYRSPEIMLSLPFNEAVDMWSLGCVAAELFLGFPLYPGNCEYDMMRYIVETQGRPPDHLLNSGGKTRHFFQKKTSSTYHLWRLKTPAEYWRETGTQSAETRSCRLNSLSDLKEVRSGVERTARCEFVNMLKKMLHLDASRRITPGQVLEHSFISMRHPESFHHRHQPSLHQQASSTTQHAQQSTPRQVHLAGMGSRAKLHHRSTNPHPSTSQTQSRVRSVKRVEVEPVERGNSNTKPRLPTSGSTQAASKSGPPNPVVITASRNGRDRVKIGSKRTRVKPDAEGSKKRARTDTEALGATAKAKNTAPKPDAERSKKRTRTEAEALGATAKTKNTAPKPDAERSKKRTRTEAEALGATAKTKNTAPKPDAERSKKRTRTETEALGATAKTENTASNQSRSQGTHGVTPTSSSSSGQAHAAAQGVVRSGSHPTAHNGRDRVKTGSKRARVEALGAMAKTKNTAPKPDADRSKKRARTETAALGATAKTKNTASKPDAEGNRKRARTETAALGATPQANTTASTSQTGTLSPVALAWYKTFIPELLPCFHSAGLGQNRANPGTKPP